MRFKRVDPTAYANTARISLVSSFMTTIMAADGEVKGIDESDVCGMNLWEMSEKERGWCRSVTRVIAGSDEGAEELEEKLGKVESDGGRCVGMVGRWWRERYGFGECCVFPGTGDNPATFLSLVRASESHVHLWRSHLVRPSEGLISLGTSDVVLVSTSSYNPHPEYHAFFHPAQIAPASVQDSTDSRQSQPLRYFNMLVYKSGSNGTACRADSEMAR